MERHLSRVSLLPRVSSLVGVCICMLVPTLCLPNHPHFYPARDPSFLLCGDGQSSDGISQNLQQSDKQSDKLGGLAGTSKVPATQVLGHGTGSMYLCAGSLGLSCSWATRCLGGQLCFTHAEDCFNCFPQTRLLVPFKKCLSYIYFVFCFNCTKH